MFVFSCFNNSIINYLRATEAPNTFEYISQHNTFINDSKSNKCVSDNGLINQILIWLNSER